MAELYTREILRLAAATAGLTRLDDPDGRAERRSPLCGSTMAVDIKLDREGRIAAFGGEVRACAMGQASAALLARRIGGLSFDELADARTALRAYLSGETEAPGPWPEMAVLAPARSRVARHAAILLPFDAALAAIEAAQ